MLTSVILTLITVTPTLSVVTLRALITAHAALDTMEMEHHATVNLISIIIIVIIIIIIIIILLLSLLSYLFINISILIVMAYKRKQIATDLLASMCFVVPFQALLNGTPENFLFQISSYACTCTCICMYSL